MSAFQVVTASKVSNLTHAMRVSIDCSTGSVGRDWRKEARPGVSDAVAGAIPGLNFAKVLFSIGILFKIALEFWNFGQGRGIKKALVQLPAEFSGSVLS